MKEKIDKFIEYFTTITKEESDCIANILKWDDEIKIAFSLAKAIFEGKEEDDDEEIPSEDDYECPLPIREYKIRVNITKEEDDE